MNERLTRLIPARRLVVAADPASALAVAVGALGAEGLVARTDPAASPAVLEYGSAATGVLGGLGLGILPGKVGKHGFAVVETEAVEGGTAVVIAHVGGYRVDVPVRAAIARATDAFRATGTLLDEGAPISAHDLPATSAGNPRTFIERGYVSGAERWLTS